MQSDDALTNASTMSSIAARRPCICSNKQQPARVPPRCGSCDVIMFVPQEQFSAFRVAEISDLNSCSMCSFFCCWVPLVGANGTEIIWSMCLEIQILGSYSVKSCIFGELREPHSLSNHTLMMPLTTSMAVSCMWTTSLAFHSAPWWFDGFALMISRERTRLILCRDSPNLTTCTKRF